ncbi:MAG: hypothetical protein IKU18_01985 [Bacteroidales bacterium]|nr:hypothetical protein [Bacteroidales bacterium]
MKKFVFSLLCAAVAFAAVSCSNNDFPPTEPVGGGPLASDPDIAGLFILNSGKMGNNNASLSYLDASTRVLSSNVFKDANGKHLGDTGNSMVIYGKKMYIAVTGSSILFVTDLRGNIIKEITVEGESANLSPRSLAQGDGKVYVSYMEGYAGEIDTANFSVKKVKVGPMPEGIAYANKKVYVANSDGYNYEEGYGKTVSVIDAATFAVTKTLDVSNNPQTLHVASNNKVYLITWGNYADIPAKLQKINTTTDTVTDVPDIEPTNMAIGKNGVAYILSTVYDENWNSISSYYTFDTTKDKLVGELASPADIPNGYSIFADKITGDVYIGTSDYISNGDVYLLSSDGEILMKFDTGGLNPIAICTVEK